MNTVFEYTGSLPSVGGSYLLQVFCDSECNGIYGFFKTGYPEHIFIMKFNSATRKWSELYRISNNGSAYSCIIVDLGRDPGDGHGKFLCHTCTYLWPQLRMIADHRIYIFDAITKGVTMLNDTNESSHPPPTTSENFDGQRMVKHGNFVYVISGIMSSGQTGRMEMHRLNLSTNIWERVIAKNQAPERRGNYEIALDDDGKSYVFGGRLAAYDYPNMIEIPYFDFKSGLWSTLQTLPDSTDGYPKMQIDFGCSYFKNNVYIVGGSEINCSFISNKIWRLDLVLGQWTKFEAALLNPILKPSVTVDAHGVLYVCGGTRQNPDGSKDRSTAMYRIRLVPQSSERLAWDAVLKVASPNLAVFSNEVLENKILELGLPNTYMNKIIW